MMCQISYTFRMCFVEKDTDKCYTLGRSRRYAHTHTLPETNSSHLKMDGWNRIVSFWEFTYFQVRTAREGIYKNICIYIYMLPPPPEKSTVFMGIVRVNSRKI